MRIEVPKLRETTLRNVPPEQAFWVCRGDQIHNINDLANCIESLSPEQFSYHVNDVKKTTHFSQWINEVLQNPLLARDINSGQNLTDQKALVKTIRDHVGWLEHTNEHEVHY